MVRIDEAGHDDAAAGVDHVGVAGVQVRSDGDDLLALDQHVGLRGSRRPADPCDITEPPRMT